MSNAQRWLPFLCWPRATAALTVPVVVIPQSVAYAGLEGMPLVTGLYATFLPMLFAVLSSASTRLSVGVDCTLDVPVHFGTAIRPGQNSAPGCHSLQYLGCAGKSNGLC